ncbi:MAG TPA: CdaR family protein [Clostridium sp.]|uniref:CdaR family protein n=1 Tax=Clostridium sp. TaxID=1506 RepID=UPI002F937A85
MDKARKQQFIIKVCCVIAAFMLWLFITSTENPLTTYKIKSIPVQLLNTDTLAQTGLILAPGQDLTTILSIKGANTSILLNTKADDFEVVADLGAYALKSGEQNIPIQIRKSPDNINVLNSDSLFIKVNLDELTQTKLPITVNITGKPKQGFYASQPNLSQTSATVSGGLKYVSTVKSIVMEENIEGVESDVSKTYKLKPLDAAGKEVSNVVVSPARINVKIPVSKTKSAEVKVKTTGSLYQGLTISSIKVTPERFDVTGNADALNALSNLNTEAIDLSKITNSNIVSTNVVIPDGLKLVSGSAVVKVEINLDKVVQKTINLDIKNVNLGAAYLGKLGTTKDTIVVSGTETVINSLNLQKFSAQVDLANLVEGEHTLKVKVSIPDGINLVSQNPGEILVTITKKQTEVKTSNDNTVK